MGEQAAFACQIRSQALFATARHADALARSAAQLYLEAADQHRGWFQVSLITGMGVRDASPFQAVLTHALILDEKYFDAFTGLGASGPAFLYVVIESMAEGGVKMGMPRDVATEVAAQACLGASAMVLDTANHPALLKDDVTTPAGCTIDGLLTLEEGGLRVTLIKAIVEATKRAGELG